MSSGKASGATRSPPPPAGLPSGAEDEPTVERAIRQHWLALLLALLVGLSAAHAEEEAGTTCGLHAFVDTDDSGLVAVYGELFFRHLSPPENLSVARAHAGSGIMSMAPQGHCSKHTAQPVHFS